MKKQLHSVIFFSTGLGDALQLLPLCGELKSHNHHLTAIFTSGCPSEEIIEPLGLFDQTVHLRKFSRLLNFIGRHLFFYDNIYIEHSSSSFKTCFISCLVAKRAITNRKKWYLRLMPNLTIRERVSEAHLLLQNLHLAFPKKQFSIAELTKVIEFKSKKNIAQPNVDGDYIAVQICAANNSVDYKNWKIENWISLFKKIRYKFPNLKIILIGDKNELAFGEKIIAEGIKNLESWIGQTSLIELSDLLKSAKMYLGLDSGSMHLAALLGTPTLTLWGPTDPDTLGYQIFDKKKHLDIKTSLSCHPCLSWIRPNTSLYNHPRQCPHNNCIRTIEPEYVFQSFLTHWERNFGSLNPNGNNQRN